MNSSTNNRKTINLIALIGVLALLGGCGGGDDKKKNNQDEGGTCLDNPIIFVVCLFTGDSQQPAVGGKPGLDSGVTSVLPTASFDEYEPNNVLGNANVMTIPGISAGTSEYVAITGNVQQQVDDTDHFIFTPPQSGSYQFYICKATCEAAAEDDAVYVMIYDQTQTTLASTPIGTTAKQEVNVDLIAGFAYYVEINGYNAGEYRYDYQLAVARD